MAVEWPKNKADDAKCGTVVPQQIYLFVGCGYAETTAVETRRGGLYGVTTLSGVSKEGNLRVPPRGARMALTDCSGNEAVRSRGQDLVSTL